MAARKEFDWSGIHPWMKMAHDIGVAGNGWHEVRRNSVEFQDWCEYFDSIAWAPWAFREVVNGQKQSFTAPCKLPQWLPNNFSCLLSDALIASKRYWPVWRMPEPSANISDEDREWVKRAFDRLMGRMRGP